MPVMTKKKPKSAGDGEPKRPNRTGIPVSFWLDEELSSALSAYIASTSPRVSKTAAYEAAIREFLERKGFLPAQPGGE